jgi:hypothetical protein
MMTHRLKTLEPYWKRVQSGEKKFEIRKNDRDFQVGDYLELEYYDPNTPSISKFYNQLAPPQIIVAKVKYILHGNKYGLEDGYCIMSIELVQ